MKILLDYLFPITSIEPTPAASTAFLKQVCVVASPKDGGVTTGTIVECSSMDEVEALVGTNAQAEIQQIFNAGKSKVYVLPMDDLDLEDALDGQGDFFTVLISSDFSDSDIELAQAEGTVTISSYANLVSGTDDAITVAGVAFTAQTGAVTLGEATFRAATGNTETAASLAAQINAHATAKLLVEATAALGVVTIKAKSAGFAGNDIGVSYTDNDTNVGATLGGLVGGKLSGGTGLLVGTFEGVVGVASDDQTFLAAQAAIANRCAFYAESSNLAKNMFFAFGSLLANALNWKNQQFITMPFADDVETLGDAESFFDDRISFVISDDEFSNRLAFFAAGGKAIAAPYIKRNLQVDMQSAALSYIASNQPGYTKTAAALLEDELQKVIDLYVNPPRAWLEAGEVEVDLVEDNFVASGNINIAEPKALWRVFAEMRQTL
jgi:hypothetical protein